MRRLTTNLPRDSNIRILLISYVHDRIFLMSDIFQKVTSDEIDPEESAEQNRRDEEIKLDKPPHHQD
ncbi:unannotated protein [freshwater metagenome]|uniref:Unannotated protein n=1 Tax=freshwater metagenome TaxID=449393 RepID=A0A6J6ZAW1_9ZZZZ